MYIEDGSSGEQITSASGSDSFGYALATDDVNGDGVGDILATRIGTYEAFLYLGPVVTGTYNGIDDDSYSGSVGFGYDAAAPGDLDSDGYGDLLVSGGTTGNAFYFMGDSAGTALSRGSMSVGRYAQDATAGDFDGDGTLDLAIGDYTDDSYQGIVRIAMGPISGAPSFTSTVDATATDYFGCSVRAGDLDDDGIDDLVVGAYSNNDAATDAGAVYVFLGQGL